MSILSTLLGLSGGSGIKTDTSAGHPCSNCPSDCSISPGACTECEPYKKRLIDAVYYVENIDAFRERYEVRDQGGSSGKVICPFCGGPTLNHQICDYCGSKLGDASAKILVESASDIPNPIMQAQDIIFERYETVVKKHAASDSGADSILDRLLSTISASEGDGETSPGGKMSEAEILEAASTYGVSVGDYLIGLDNGKYLTLAGCRAAKAQGGDKTEKTPAGAGISGVAAVGSLAAALLSSNVNAGQKWQDPGHEDYRGRRPDTNGRGPEASRKVKVREITNQEGEFRPGNPEIHRRAGGPAQEPSGNRRYKRENNSTRESGTRGRNGGFH